MTNQKKHPFPFTLLHKFTVIVTQKSWLTCSTFCAGIPTPYNWLLNITRDLANQILHQHDLDVVFIHAIKKKNIFSIITKYNTGHNARSATATKHYQGRSFSVFQFPFVAFPGDMISYPDESFTTIKLSNSKKLVAFSHHTQKFEDGFHHLLQSLF